MRRSLRLLRPAPNQNIENPRLWQDPVLGYYETHGKTEFVAGEHYNLTDEEKKAVLWRYRVKEILKKEYLRREFDPHTFKYKQGVVLDPAMFRWYAADMTQVEFFRITPKSMFLYTGLTMFAFYFVVKAAFVSHEKSTKPHNDGELVWWHRMNHRMNHVAGNANHSPHVGWNY